MASEPMNRIVRTAADTRAAVSAPVTPERPQGESGVHRAAGTVRWMPAQGRHDESIGGNVASTT